MSWDFDLTPPQYGTGLHYPYCLGSCTGCLPPPPATQADDEQRKPFDLSLFRHDI
ncbi:hypothetical protein ACQPZJ_01695 [Actinoplanes sp. CA-054009]